MKKSLVAIGLMSGTSMDGVDAALLKTDGEGLVERLGCIHTQYDKNFHLALKIAEFAVRESRGKVDLDATTVKDFAVRYLLQKLAYPQTKLAQQLKELADSFASKDFPDLSMIVQRSTEYHINAAEEVRKQFAAGLSIDCVGYHGQTLFYDPKQKVAAIVGDGALMAKRLGFKVVYQFRSNDLKHGGRGAPLAPIYHQALCRASKVAPAVVLNVGGIANPTVVGDKDGELWAFDAGPGNGLIDRFVRLKTEGRELIDALGAYGLKGVVNDKALEALLKGSVITSDGKNYVDLPPPKALDSGDFKLLDDVTALSLNDGCRTLAAFTAECVVRGLKHTTIKQKIPSRMIVCGGGAKNKAILAELLHRAHSVGVTRVQTADELGWNSSAIEAELFAYLAVRSQKGLPITFPGTTGAPKALSGGVLCG